MFDIDRMEIMRTWRRQIQLRVILFVGTGKAECGRLQAVTSIIVVYEDNIPTSTFEIDIMV